MAEEMRVQKYLSKAGVCSRRTAEDLMLQGRVKINDKVCKELGTKVTAPRDKVEVDGEVVDLPDSYIYILMNKPPNVITTLDDPKNRTIITDMLPDNMPRIWPVGRLDWDTEGVILLTNDGKVTHLMTHPSHDVTKEYAVKVQGLIAPSDKKLDKIRDGLDIGDEEPTRPAFVRVTGDTGRNTWLELAIGEGRNRQVRRMFETIGHPVMKLRRLRIGPLTIDGLASGTYRSLHSDEVRALYRELEAQMPERAKPTNRQIKREREAKKRR